MRGKHYGTDFRWYLRSFQPPTMDGVTEAQEGPGSEKDDEPKNLHKVPPSLRHLKALEHVTGKELPSSGAADPDVVSTPPDDDGSLGAARQRTGAGVPASNDDSLLAAKRRTSMPRPTSQQDALLKTRFPRSTPSTESSTEALPDLTQHHSVKELGRHDLGQLVEAFRTSGMAPSHGVKLVAAWAQQRQISPETLLGQLQALKASWKATPTTPVVPTLAPDPSEWDYDDSVAEVLGQRDNVGRGPKDIDRERMRLLQLMMDSFAGQAQYGFTNGEVIISGATEGAGGV